MINKKGLLGKIIDSFPVFIFIVIIMAIFLFLSAGTGLLKGSNLWNSADITISTKELMLETIKVQLPDGTSKELMVFDALNLYFDYEAYVPGKTSERKLNFTELSRGFEQLKKNGDCYFVTFDVPREGFGTQLNNPVQANLGEQVFREDNYKKSKRNFGVNQVQYFYGRCPNE